MLANAGMIDPLSRAQYEQVGGFEALRRAAADPEMILAEISASGLCGRGGAYFPVGKKWSLVRDTPAAQKYVVANADEGEPGTCKDRLILKSLPREVLEGMVVAGIASGASEGILYLRGEYADLEPMLQRIIDEDTRDGYLGSNIFGSGHDFNVRIVMGEGSYLCGEETALLESLEGYRAEPRLKPPYPGVSGYLKSPTVINNVETLANVPAVIRDGAAAFRSCGTERLPGTKLFTASGDVQRPGVYELPIGASLRDLYELAGGINGGRQLKGMQIGGASGSLVRAGCLDACMDPEGCAAIGTMLGTGSVLFFPEGESAVSICLRSIRFFADESCGKCTPCRQGLEQMRRILAAMDQGQVRKQQLEELGMLAAYVGRNAFYGLGQMAVTPVLTGLKNFPEDFEARVRKEEF